MELVIECRVCGETFRYNVMDVTDYTDGIKCGCGAEYRAEKRGVEMRVTHVPPPDPEPIAETKPAAVPKTKPARARGAK